MCYSAKVKQDYREYVRRFGADISIQDYVRLFWERNQAAGPTMRIPKGMENAFAQLDTTKGREIRQLVDEWRSGQITATEQELFAQKKRLNDAERALQTKITKKAQNEQRIAGNKVEAAKRRLADLKRTGHEARDDRIYPGYWCTVMVSENGRNVLRPMRYQCRPQGKPAFYDRTYPGTYNARRDNLEGFWKGQFGHTHGLILVETFYENVEGADGKNQVIQFTPRDGSVMLVACLWSHWTDPKGKEPDLLSFAAITDAPEPEVAAAGHDRTIINIKPEHVDAWLNPDPARLDALYAIFDDKQHPYYEHRLAA
ncbi:SOS response-associated peptidase family protein [Luteimonas sp. e5]